MVQVRKNVLTVSQRGKKKNLGFVVVEQRLREAKVWRVAHDGCEEGYERQTSALYETIKHDQQQRA
jgi:hypothetical protein